MAENWLDELADACRMLAMTALLCVSRLCYRIMCACGRGIEALSLHDECR